MAVRVGSARIDEYGKITGGKVGDQTGKEVSIQNWYKSSKGWIVIRALDDKVREKIAYAMEGACANNNIGYDQTNRNGLYNNCKNFGFDPRKVTVKTETDCSATVRVCVHYAGITVGDFNTSTEKNMLQKTGKFQIITSSSVCNSSTNLMRGDILVTKTKGHTVVVLDDGANVVREKASSADPNVNPYAEPTTSTLKKGSRGNGVKWVQWQLNKVPGDKFVLDKYKSGTKLAIDGIFGDSTHCAVYAFQKSMNLKADGIVGKDTRTALKTLVPASKNPVTSTTPQVSYYAKYNGTSTKIDAVFEAIGVPTKYRGSAAKRKPIAQANGLKSYIGSYVHNTKLIDLAKRGKLVKP